jgi:hypothetical protein
MQIKCPGVLFIDEAQVLLTTLSNRFLFGTGDQKGSAFTALLTHGTGSGVRRLTTKRAIPFNRRE